MTIIDELTEEGSEESAAGSEGEGSASGEGATTKEE